MVLGHAERYIVEQHPNAVVIKMRQRSNALGSVVMSLGVLIAIWWFGPYGRHPTTLDGTFYWIFSSVWALFGFLGLLGAMYRGDWTITAHEVIVTKSLAGCPRISRVKRGPSLAVRVEQTARARKRGPFPCAIHILDLEGRPSGFRLDLQRRESVDELLKTLRSVTLQVDDRH